MTVGSGLQGAAAVAALAKNASVAAFSRMVAIWMTAVFVLITTIMVTSVRAEDSSESAQSERTPKFYQLRDDREIDDLLRSVLGYKKLSRAERLAKVGALFLGTPYRSGPLGEGPDGEFDRDPLINFKAADCTTLVEQTMALALAGNLKAGIETLQKIRYKNGVVRYETRNHFPEADWIPNNIAAGYLRDITRRIAGAKTRVATKVVRKSVWYAQKAAGDLSGFDGETAAEREERVRRWRELGRQFPEEAVHLDYLPIEHLHEFLDRIPSGTIANLVREPKDDKPTLISHQVFIFDGPGGKIVRHAAAGKEVMDAAAMEYFNSYAGSKWKLLGFNLNEVVELKEKTTRGRRHGR